MTMGPGFEAPVTIERKRPRNARMELTFQGVTSVQACDGQKAWGILPMGSGQPEPLPPEMARDLDNQADIDGPLVDYKAKGHAVELVGKEKLDAAEVWRLKVTLRGGDVRLHAARRRSATSSSARRRERLIRGSEVEIATRLSAYKAVGGVLWPHRIEAGPKSRSEKQALVFDKIEINPPLDDARFRLPAAASRARSTTDDDPHLHHRRHLRQELRRDHAASSTSRTPTSRRCCGSGAAGSRWSCAR